MKEARKWSFYWEKFKRFGLYGLIILGLLSVALKLSMSFLVDALMENFFNEDPQAALGLSGLLVGFALILAVLMKVKISQEARLQQRIELALAQPLVEKIHRIRGDYVDAHGMGGWMTIFSQDIKDYARLFASTLPEIFVGMISFAAALAFGLIKSPLLTGVILMISSLSVLLTRLLSRRLEGARQSEQEMNEEVQQSLLEVFSSLPLLRVFGAHAFGQALFQKNFKAYKMQRMKREKMSFFMEALSMGTGFVLTTSWIAAAFYLIQSGHLTMGEFLGFLLLDSYFNWVFFSLPGFYSDLKIQLVSGERLATYEQELFYKEEVEEEALGPWERLTLNHLDYAYRPEGPEVLKDLSLEIGPGDKINLAGESGSGKSTLIKVLTGYYPLQAGQVSLDGKAIPNLQALRQYMSFVPQDNVLFPGSLWDNICLGRSVGGKELDQVLAASGLSDLVASLEKGLETRLESGSKENLSQGQIQRIGLARALVERTPILLLDEPTSALDEANEKIITDYLADTDQAVLLVTHRPTSVAENFQTRTLKQGRLLETR